MLFLLLACASPDSGPKDDRDGDGVADPDDCAPDDPSAFPGATESCDGVDEDCDGSVDEDVGGTWYTDLDGDGHGDPATGITACDGGDRVADGTDCDDGEALAWSGAAESCDGVDNDCDGSIDEGLAAGWVDADGDGYGSEVPDCASPVAQGGDCDDDDATVSPGAIERCNGFDDDCDGETDENLLSPWYLDEDGDGFGLDASEVEACAAPEGHVDDGGDCDDADAAVHPDATETCDGVDDDCDGRTDDDDPDLADVLYRDDDGDGFGNSAVSTPGCAAYGVWVADGSDCDDGDPDVNPTAAETCDDEDQDCDGLVDDDDPDLATTSTWHPDDDGDGYGDAATATVACDAPAGWTGDGRDCDDADDSISPAATERCDGGGADEDCDGFADDDDPEGASGRSSFYADADADGYGDLDSGASWCSAPAGWLADDSDCDDADATVHPGAPEVCDDGVDQDCDSSPGACGLVGERSGADAALLVYGSAGDWLGNGDAPVLVADVDGDGQDDLVVGASVSGAGSVYTLFGPLSADTPLSAADAVLAQAGTSGSFGGSLSWAADLDGDGVKDLLVTDSGHDHGDGTTGSIYVFSGWTGSGGDPATAGATIEAPYTSFGHAAAVGDFDGDGVGDVFAATYWSDGMGVWSGPLVGTLAPADAVAWFEGGVQGGSVAATGDFNGDGLADWALSADGNYSPELYKYSGELNVHYGPFSGTYDWDDDADTHLYGRSESAPLGDPVPADVDGDGTDDLIVSSGVSSTGGSAVFLSPLPATGSSSTGDIELLPTDEEDFGGVACLAADLDGDGSVDVGVNGEMTGSTSSYEIPVARIKYGPMRDGQSVSAYDAVFTEAEYGGDASAFFFGPGDLDGDGRLDLFFGTDTDETGGEEAGALWLFAAGGA